MRPRRSLKTTFGTIVEGKEGDARHTSRRLQSEFRTFPSLRTSLVVIEFSCISTTFTTHWHRLVENTDMAEDEDSLIVTSRDLLEDFESVNIAGASCYNHYCSISTNVSRHGSQHEKKSSSMGSDQLSGSIEPRVTSKFPKFVILWSKYYSILLEVFSFSS